MVLFVFIGPGSAVSHDFWTGGGSGGGDFMISVSLSFGLAISVLVYTFAPVSGGHINPAVTLSFFLRKEISLSKMMLYWTAQFLGAVVGAAVVWGTASGSEVAAVSGLDLPSNLGSNFVHPNSTLGGAFLGETMGTFLLVITVLMTAVNRKSIAGINAPIAIGWSVALAHLILIPFTGCGINPARSFGPHVIAILNGVNVGTNGWWIFYTAPFIGSTLASATYKFIFEDDDVVEAQPSEQLADQKQSEGSEELF